MKPARIILLLIVLIACTGTAIPVSAHALLLRSNPTANAVLATSPAQVELFFSEAVAQGLSSLKVFDSNGKRADQGDMRVDSSSPTRMTVSLPALAVGVYTVSWTAVSATDGHQTEGSFSFGVGDVNAANLPTTQQTSSSSLPASALISKWLILVSLALLAGRVPFLWLVWKPALKSDAGNLPETVVQPPAWDRLTHFGLVGALVAVLLGLLAQAGQATGAELALPWAPAMVVLLSTTRLGLIWLIRLVLVLLAIWFSMGRPAAWKVWLRHATALALLLSISMTSHAATEAQPFVPVADDWIHMIGMTAWLGGLAYLLIGLCAMYGLEARLRTRLTSLSMERFSGMALVTVVVIVCTGLYSASLRVGTLHALLSSIYGHALLLKLTFIALLLALAGISLVIISPRLKRSRLRAEANSSLVNRFVKIVLAEATLAAFLLMAVSLLTYLPPAKINPLIQELTASARVDDLAINLTITPGLVGQNTFQLRLASKSAPVVTVNQALLRFTPQMANMAPSEGELISHGDGIYTAKGTYLSLPGSWQVQIVVRRPNKFDTYANFNFTIHKPGEANPAVATPRYAGVLFLVMGSIVVLLAAVLPIRPWNRFAYGILPFILLVSLGTYFLTLPVAVTTSEANPIAPNSASIAVGQAVYTKYCERCHGISGKGDGPDGLLLNPRPADLTQHGVPGVHTDAQLFDWITNGLPGTRMPAWKNNISDTDRWNLVNYIRYLAQAAQ
jgi:copper transport protein